MRETALGEQLKRGGFIPREVRFSIAIAEFLNNGGTIDRAHELIAVAADKMGGGAKISMPQGQAGLAAASHTHDGGAGRTASADEASFRVPASPSPNAAKGQTSISGAAKREVPTAAPHQTTVTAHVRGKPGHARRGAFAIASVQATMSRSLFDTLRLEDGRTLREVRWSECPNLASKYRRMSRILMAVHNVGIPADANTTLDNLVSEDRLKEIVSAVEAVNDIA